MNKATFSRLIKDNTYLSDADVVALEQVVQAFPYCQTAHMLLAKAASDKGSMLAPQRLRKAAIHAPSRALLKKLVEGKLNRPDPALLSGNSFNSQAQPSYNEEIEDLLENDLPESPTSGTPVAEPEITEVSPPPVSAVENQNLGEENTEVAESAQENLVRPVEPAAEKPILPTLPETEEEVVIAEALPEELEEAGDWAAVAKSETSGLFTEADSGQETKQAEATETGETGGLNAFLAGLQSQPHLSELEAPELQPDLSEPAEKRFASREHATPVPEKEDNVLAEDSGEAATEAVPKPEIAVEESAETDQLNSEITATSEPEILAETETEEKQLAKEITSLNQAENAPAPELPEPDYSDSLIFSIYRDNALGYAMSSSRMGESLQPKSELTRDVPFHFQPELLVEYRHTQADPEQTAQAESKPIPQQDLINDFLKQASKTRPRANMLPKPEEQEDLSQKSTRLSKSIVSENLAQIFAMQGKTKKAIKIYQQLQLKMPEKKDYFAVLINKLQNQSS